MREITEATPIRLPTKEDRRLDRQVENVEIFLRLLSSPFVKRPKMRQEHALLRSRTCPSCM